MKLEKVREIDNIIIPENEIDRWLINEILIIHNRANPESFADKNVKYALMKKDNRIELAIFNIEDKNEQIA